MNHVPRRAAQTAGHRYEFGLGPIGPHMGPYIFGCPILQCGLPYFTVWAQGTAGGASVASVLCSACAMLLLIRLLMYDGGASQGLSPNSHH